MMSIYSDTDDRCEIDEKLFSSFVYYIKRKRTNEKEKENDGTRSDHLLAIITNQNNPSSRCEYFLISIRKKLSLYQRKTNKIQTVSMS
jgi:hypothetical protein